jgi:D-lactate dehydrogenase
MRPMKIVVFEVEPWERSPFQRLASEHELVFTDAALEPGLPERFRDAEIVSPFIYSSVSKALLDQMPRLKLIATRSTGLDHVDTGACQDRGITVTNVPSYGEHTVAEHTFALLLAVSRKVVQAVERTRRGDFSLRGLQGVELAGRTLGVIGTGAIGRKVIRIARGFDMDVVAFDVQPDRDVAERLGFTYLDLHDLLGRSHVVTVHVPGVPATEHLLSWEEFAAMRHGTILVNTARGSVVDTQALMAALEDGTIVGAGLDVLEEEPTIREEVEVLRRAIDDDPGTATLLRNHVLLRVQDVVVTPHIGFYTREATRSILETTVRNIESWLAGEPRDVAVEGSARMLAGGSG